MRIVITSPGNLLPVTLDREITEAQASMVELLLDQENLTYGELLWLLDGERQQEAQEGTNG